MFNTFIDAWNHANAYAMSFREVGAVYKAEVGYFVHLFPYINSVHEDYIYESPVRGFTYAPLAGRTKHYGI